jgi:hypothetical protein
MKFLKSLLVILVFSQINIFQVIATERHRTHKKLTKLGTKRILNDNQKEPSLQGKMIEDGKV